MSALSERLGEHVAMRMVERCGRPRPGRGRGHRSARRLPARRPPATDAIGQGRDAVRRLGVQPERVLDPAHRAPSPRSSAGSNPRLVRSRTGSVDSAAAERHEDAAYGLGVLGRPRGDLRRQVVAGPLVEDRCDVVLGRAGERGVDGHHQVDEPVVLEPGLLVAEPNGMVQAGRELHRGTDPDGVDHDRCHRRLVGERFSRRTPGAELADVVAGGGRDRLQDAMPGRQHGSRRRSEGRAPPQGAEGRRPGARSRRRVRQGRSRGRAAVPSTTTSSAGEPAAA